jgi:hypothetical protein
LREAAPTHHRKFFIWQKKTKKKKSKKASKKSNKTADKNIKLHHATAEMEGGEEKKKLSTQRDTTFWRERVNFIVAPRQSLFVFFLYVRARDFGVQVCASKKLSA